MINDFDTLRTHIANFAVRCAEKLRRQQSVAHIVGVFIDSNHFRPELEQYWNMTEVAFPTPDFVNAPPKATHFFDVTH